MTENEKIELFDKWYDENYDEWAEGEEGIALREELEQAFKGGIATLEKENAELKADNSEWEKASDKWKSVYELTNNQLTKAIEIIKKYYKYNPSCEYFYEDIDKEAEQFLKECK